MPTDASENLGDSEFACPICMSDANYPVLTQCGHIYCYSCLKLWLTNSRESNCAVCRAPVSLSSGLTPVYAGRQEGEDPRPHGDLCREINAAREERDRARNRFRLPRLNAQVNFAAQNLTPLDLLFNGLLNILRERADQDEQNLDQEEDNARQAGNLNEDPVLVMRNRRRLNIRKLIRAVLSGLLVVIWVAIQMYFNTPRIQVYRFGANQEH
ncbi:Zinc finger domain-containing protein [Giardia lamblia P15]|uniref:RING-type E3 ubiquitin transferase n=1 Tax=Giardia intestinalis (strain P15) TaxID=658858 RepID=E1F6P6_GIAIA|nr:Zinc finger domain-containing protein [Giardia lamblia P15]